VIVPSEADVATAMPFTVAFATIAAAIVDATVDTSAEPAATLTISPLTSISNTSVVSIVPPTLNVAIFTFDSSESVFTLVTNLDVVSSERFSTFTSSPLIDVKIRFPSVSAEAMTPGTPTTLIVETT